MIKIQPKITSQEGGDFSADSLLNRLVEALQPSPTEHERAVRAYGHVGGWVCDPDAWAGVDPPEFEPQGSFALGTPVRPLFQHEFDFDAIAPFSVDPRSVSSDEVYAMLEHRLSQHADLHPRIERLPRCIRLHYAGDFHLDVVPACFDPRGGGRMLVPASKAERRDRSALSSWKPSDPRGYASWFSARCMPAPERAMSASVAPAPPYRTPEQKAALRKFVIVLKARRNHYYTPETAPSSILLTTMAANAYIGQSFTLSGYAALVDEMARQATSQHELHVPNPTMEEEDLAAPLGSDGRAALARFLCTHRDELVELSGVRGIDDSTRHLRSMYGEGPASRAVRSLGEALAEAKDNGRLHSGRAKVTLAAGAGITASPTILAKPNPSHTFYGGRPSRGAPCPAPRSLDNQAAMVRLVFPGFSARVRRGGLLIRGQIQPTPMSRTYDVRVEYTGGPPLVYVDSPLLENNEQGEAPPHRYPDPGNPLCLFYPRYREWSRRDAIATTIIPWAAEWLAFYEVWRATGTWLGGGVNHPPLRCPDSQEAA